MGAGKAGAQAKGEQGRSGKRADGRLVFNSRSGSGPSGPAYVIMWDYDVKRLVKDPIAVSAFVAST